MLMSITKVRSLRANKKKNRQGCSESKQYWKNFLNRWIPYGIPTIHIWDSAVGAHWSTDCRFKLAEADDACSYLSRNSCCPLFCHHHVVVFFRSIVISGLSKAKQVIIVGLHSVFYTQYDSHCITIKVKQPFSFYQDITFHCGGRCPS